MEKTDILEMASRDNFAVAQVVLYIFAVFQAAAALMAGINGVPFGINAEATQAQKILVTVASVMNILGFFSAYLIIARCLNKPNKLVWRIAFCIFLVNGVMAAASLIIHVVAVNSISMCSLSIAGLISLWKGRDFAVIGREK